MKIAIFINGCFWHRCPFCKPSIPATNREYWMNKFSNNVARDKANYEKLESEGWRVIVIWECEIKKDLNQSMSKITAALTKSVRIMLFKNRNSYGHGFFI